MLHPLHQQIVLAYKFSGMQEQGGLGWSQIPSLNYCFSPPLYQTIILSSSYYYLLFSHTPRHILS